MTPTSYTCVAATLGSTPLNEGGDQGIDVVTCVVISPACACQKVNTKSLDQMGSLSLSLSDISIL